MVTSLSNLTLTRLLNVPGLPGRTNDLILSRNSHEKSSNLVLFFHGDIQDYPEIMKLNQSAKKYLQWNLEDTAKMLAGKFSNSVVMTVKADVMRLGVKACFDNFVETDIFGEPVFDLDIKPFAHLQQLTDQVVKRSGWLSNLECIKLVGFSQGMTVVNQLIHSFHVLGQSSDRSLESFASLIKNIYWLDGGKCWLTDEKVISSLKERDVFGHVYVTPLQVCNPDRSENQINYKIFLSHLEALKVKHVHKLYYKDTKPSFDSHFNLLRDFDS